MLSDLSLFMYASAFSGSSFSKSSAIFFMKIFVFFKKDICDSLVPPWVSLGLASCMEEAANRLGRQNAIAIDMNMDSSIDVSQECTLALFRIFQEAVSNAVRHGGATSVSVDVERLTLPGRSIRMCIVDNGRGFDTAKTFSSDLRLEGKRGLAGIRQRVELSSRSEERRVGKECRSRWSPYH